MADGAGRVSASTSPSLPHGSARPLTWSLLALVVAGFALQVRVLSVGGGAALWPFTDAFEYASMAHWMVQGEGPALRIGPAFLPARVPPTLSVLLLPQAWLEGDPRHFWVTVFGAGVACVVGCAALARALGLGGTGALAAAALLAVSPGFAAYSGYVMSDVPALAGWLLACGCTLRLARRGGDDPVALAGAGLAAGLLVAFRLTNAVWLAPLAFVVPLGAWRGIARRPLALAAAAVLGALPVGALAVYHARVFGSPLASGYAFWLDESRFFAWAHIGDNLLFHAAQLAGVRSELLGRPLGWASDLYSLPVALLGAIGLGRMTRSQRIDAAARRLVLAVAAATLLALAAYAGFRWREGRFLFPVVPFAALGCAFLTEEVGARFGARGPLALTVWILAASEALLLLPLPQPAPLVLSTRQELARPLPVGDGVVATRLPLALAALFAPRAAVLVPGCEEPIGRDVHVELIRRNALRPLRVDPGREAIWADLAHGALGGRETRCTRRSPSHARGMRPGSR
jgi:4-amino-4-deoxy-L-arabinose transferase-like glycosyltransferase